jgi:hypothetical protein
MSLRISLASDQVENRLSSLGIPCRFTDDERQVLSAAPNISIDEGVLCFPTPRDNSALTLSNIRTIVGIDPARQPSFFDHAWYAGEPFMDKPCPPGWHVIYKDALPDSICQPSGYAQKLGAGLALPTAIEVVLMLFLHYAGTREQLLSRKHTWCSDAASLGRVVTVGAFGRNGVFLSAHPPNFASRGLGICPKVLF